MPNYYTGRPTIAIPRPDSTRPRTRGIALDNIFAFPQAMAALMPAYQAGNLLVVHATGSIDPSRSHFDAQRFMEVGKPRDRSVATGWLGRHLASVPPCAPTHRCARSASRAACRRRSSARPRRCPSPIRPTSRIAGATATRTERTNWLRDDYATGAEPVRSAALDALEHDRRCSRLINFTGYAPANGAVYPNTAFGRGMRSTAALIKADIGVEAMQIDLGGWDTHATQDPLAGSMFNTHAGPVQLDWRVPRRRDRSGLAAERDRRS